MSFDMIGWYIRHGTFNIWMLMSHLYDLFVHLHYFFFQIFRFQMLLSHVIYTKGKMAVVIRFQVSYSQDWFFFLLLQGFDNKPPLGVLETASDPKTKAKGHVNPGFEPTNPRASPSTFGNHVEGITNPRYSPEVPSSYPPEGPANDAHLRADTQRLHAPGEGHMGALRKVPSSPSSLAQRVSPFFFCFFSPLGLCARRGKG